jgi:hypothetical protein
MKRRPVAFALGIVLLLSACSLLPATTRNGAPVNPADQAAPPAPQPTVTPAPQPGTPQIAILSPLEIDSADGRLYATGQVNGQARLLVLNAADGSLLAAWDTLGALALDAERDRLAVDRGRQGLALLNAVTGEVTGVVDLPAQDGPPAPRIDAETGLVYAFREATIYVIDPAIADVVEALPLSVGHTVCDEPAGDAPIYQTAYDATAGRLYLAFITYNCIPWVTMTLVAYDAAELTETGRHDVDIQTQFAPYDGRLVGLSVSRLGPTLFWDWDGAADWQETSGDFGGAPAGMAIDSERSLIYEAVGETLRVVDPDGRTLRSEVAVPLLAGSRLAGHDAGHDWLYFVSPAGRLSLWSAANLFDAASPPQSAPSALPAAPVTWLALSPNWANDGTMAALVDAADCPGEGGALYIMLDSDAGWQPASPPGESFCATVTAAAFSPD